MATNCAMCRLMRGFAFSGMGAALFGGGSLYCGASQNDAMYWALGGTLFFAMLMAQLDMRKKKRRQR
ncbi:MAG TPA: hypothetical protein EYN73_03355 [Chromatiaceae bacterium]|jgi:hypothetical protein|nr:hypothetical protein [Chromatiaceae bacterium]HIN82638.1 hypothetical protein [Chromatiales bacterium]HIA08109.1 hypothetical protein [Chromatiaceae bacterium]HIB85418.1 hypothetical protein [Chromatiaceae bacterium]HIO14834.1 hypothetical protein [Chromatiales bacterium]